MNPCPLCVAGNDPVLWENEELRVILVTDADYPAFCRIIWNRHVREMTDLASGERDRLMGTVFTVESVLRELMQPDKINLASLGNQVPHLHWHVIPRFPDDAHFPDPVWAVPRRHGNPHAVDRRELEKLLMARLLNG